LGNYLAKMKEYLSMDSELPYDEFDQYFQDYIAYLGLNYEGFDQESTVKARFIVSILNVNSVERARSKGPHAKKFKKMGEKSKVWVDALNYRLLKQGMTQDQIDAANQAVSEAM